MHLEPNQRNMQPFPHQFLGKNQNEAIQKRTIRRGSRERIKSVESAKGIMTACIDLLIGHPLLALVPSIGFFVLTFYTRRLTVAFAAIAWALYAAYEEAMRLNFFCPRGCNIRLDLILIYPVLIVLSIAGLIVGLRGRRSAQLGIP
jgi:hypothetical protein